ncbi:MULTISPECIES: hypothetical protein [Arthrobacter]|uniref:Uncharacterized protein n=1 Tax=Arthrobacter terricola TaxID=2547396 RepID=A0A4V2ZTE7_9MICC|nr:MULTISPECIES: hypothetical protein [Arthrobacter]MBT8161045.1 hypothetical protein [Arthrobacter sp. GN70]TDF96904.1 hypothetical protein E1809_09285 [Arthrobacter terricola]
MTAQITQEQHEAAAHVLWYFKREGWQPGSFTESLLSTFGKADMNNVRKLAGAFPELGDAFQLGAYFAGGIEILRERFNAGLRQ